MKRAGLPVMLAGLLLAGCGGEGERFPEGKVLEAAQVEGDDTVQGDPFCEVEQVLNSDAAIEQAGGEESGNIITSKVGNVGVEVVPPFPDDCYEIVRRGLNQLDPVPSEEQGEDVG